MIVSTFWEDPCVGCSGERRDYSLGGGSVQVYKTLCAVAPAYPPLQPHPSNPPCPATNQSSNYLQFFNQTKPSQLGPWVFVALEDHFFAPSQDLCWKRAMSPPKVCQSKTCLQD